MIGKRIPNPRPGASKADRITGLTEYIREPERCPDHPEAGAHGIEKCAYHGARGFMATDPEAQIREMIALAEAAPRSDDPVRHYVLSWRAGEHPTREQVEQAVSLLLEEMGLKDHQVVWGFHQDTDNDHIHLAINRVHPVTERVIKINGGWDYDALSRTVARIEREQGWAHEENALWRIDERGELERTRPYGAERRGGNTRIRDGERRTGAKSATTIARERAGHLFKTAKSWRDLHASLAQRGLTYETKGSGALVRLMAPDPVDDVRVKASDVSRDASLAKRVKQLGEYQPPTAEQIAAARAAAAHLGPEPTARAAETTSREDWTEFQRQFRAGSQRDRDEMRKRHRAESRQLRAHQAAQRKAATSGNWTGRGGELNALRSQLAAQAARERAEVRDRQAAERKGLARRRAKDYENWLRAQGRIRQADDYARWVPPRFAGSGKPPVPHNIRAFSATVCGTEVQYRRDRDLRLAFIDRGRTIDMTSSREDDATLAALQVAQAKWGKVSIRGSAEFRERAARFAAREGIQVEDADLQAVLRDERERMARGEPDSPGRARLQAEAKRQGEQEDEQDLGR